MFFKDIAGFYSQICMLRLPDTQYPDFKFFLVIKSPYTRVHCDEICVNVALYEIVLTHVHAALINFQSNFDLFKWNYFSEKIAKRFSPTFQKCHK